MARDQKPRFTDKWAESAFMHLHKHIRYAFITGTLDVIISPRAWNSEINKEFRCVEFKCMELKFHAFSIPQRVKFGCMEFEWVPLAKGPS